MSWAKQGRQVAVMWLFSRTLKSHGSRGNQDWGPGGSKLFIRCMASVLHVITVAERMVPDFRCAHDGRGLRSLLFLSSIVGGECQW